MADDPLARLDRLLARPLREVRVNAPRPPPPRPPRRPLYAIADLRVIVALEGRKEEVFGDGVDVVHWVMQPGDALVVRPGTWLSPRFHTRHRHFGLMVGGGRASVLWSRCDGDASARQPLAYEATCEVPLAEHGAAQRAADALTGLDPQSERAAAPQLVAGLLHLLRAAIARPREPLGKGERTWQQVLAYVHDRAHLQLGRDEVAQAIGVSPNHLSRLCRAHGGRSFLALLTGIRLERAAAMLRGVDLPVAEVARTCGFADPGYFIRRFRRAYDATPGAYRRARG